MLASFRLPLRCWVVTTRLATKWLRETGPNFDCSSPIESVLFLTAASTALPILFPARSAESKWYSSTASLR